MSESLIRFDEKVAIVTGANTGLGQGIAVALAEAGEFRQSPAELKRYKQGIEGDDPRLAFYRRFNLQWNLADQDQDAVNLLSVPMTVRDLQTAPLSARLTRLP